MFDSPELHLNAGVARPESDVVVGDPEGHGDHLQDAEAEGAGDAALPQRLPPQLLVEPPQTAHVRAHPAEIVEDLHYGLVEPRLQ